MEDDLNRLFAEIERQEIEVSIFARPRKGDKTYLSYALNKVYGVEVRLGITQPGEYNAQVSVSGKGSTFRQALGDAYNRLRQLTDVLEFKPQPSDLYPPESPISDDDTPF